MTVLAIFFKFAESLWIVVTASFRMSLLTLGFITSKHFAVFQAMLEVAFCLKLAKYRILKLAEFV